MARSITLWFQKIFGGFLLFSGIFALILGMAMSLDEKDAYREAGRGIAMVSNAITLPGAALLYLYRRKRRELELIESIAVIVKSYRRITVADLAGKIGCPAAAAGKLLARAIAAGSITGNFDRTTDEFFTDEARRQDVKYRFCPGCGAPLDRVYLEGETVTCGRCGVLI